MTADIIIFHNMYIKLMLLYSVAKLNHPPADIKLAIKG